MPGRNLLASISFTVCGMAFSQQPSAPGVLWEQAIDAGVHQQFAILNAVTTDQNGNVYATGKIDSREGCTDLLTIKYGPTGIKLWEVRYNSPTNEEEAGVFVAVDQQGNVYVAGTSTFQDSLNAAVGIFIKYNPDGTEQWVKMTLNGEGTTETWAAFATDNEGNIYVTGHRVHGGSDQSDFITRKINHAGDHVWVAVYAGPEGRNDAASRVAVDGFGNVYVTGQSVVEGYPDFRESYVTIKYAPDGTRLWYHRYLLPELSYGHIDAMSVDHTGRVAVSGRTNWGSIAQTIQYDQSGNIEWENVSQNFASSLAHDSDGGLYLAGTAGSQGGTLHAVKYKPSGVEEWRFTRSYPQFAFFDSPQLKLDHNNGIIIASPLEAISESYHNGAFLITLTRDGQPRWETYPQASTMLRYLHALKDIAVDHDGNIVVLTILDTVSLLRQNGIEQARVLKYSQDGSLLWDKTESGHGISDGSIYAMEIDDQGNAYVTGSCRNIASGLDYVTAKINPRGIVEWVSTYDGPLSKTDFASFVALDDSGNVYVSGMSLAYETGVDYATIMYSPKGEQLWVARHTNMVNPWLEDRVRDLLVDPTGVYVAGSAGLVKYDHSGNILWSTVSPAFAIAVDVYGNIYAKNETELIKRTRNGLELWTRYASSYDDEVAVDGFGDVYISRSGGGIRKFDANGNELWGRPHGGKKILFDEDSNVYTADFRRASKIDPAGTLVYSIVTEFEAVGDLALDNRGNLFVTGNTYNGSAWESKTIKISPSGSIEWGTPPNTAFGYRTFGVRATNQGDIIVAGQTIRSDMSSSPSITKLTEVVTDVAGEIDILPLADGLASNYPNPFNPETHIGFRISRPGHVSLKVFDMLGREVAHLVNEELEPGNHTASWNANAMASGVYFYTLITNGIIETRRMMLIR